MILSTMNDLPGYEVTEVIGEVFGITVTPASRMPHGTMRSYHDRSQSQFSASPCMVAPRATRAPIAPPSDRRTRDPGAAAARHPHRRDTELGAGPDHGLFERSHVGDHVHRLAELEDRVAGQLPRPVPGDLAAAIHVNDRRPGIPEQASRPFACPPCTRARAPAAGSCPGPRRPPVARGCAAADPSPPCTQQVRGRRPGTQARSLSPAYARPQPRTPVRRPKSLPAGSTMRV